MVRLMKNGAWVLVAVLTTVFMPSAQTQRQREQLSIHGYTGEVNVFRSQGHLFADVQDLARITKGSLSFENNRIILVIPPKDNSQPAVDERAKAGFSPVFRRAGIEEQWPQCESGAEC